jgi:nucleotide-binding universal stress UspA family protein
MRFAEQVGFEIKLLHGLEPETPLTLTDRVAVAAFSQELEHTESVKQLKSLVDCMMIATHGYMGWKRIAIGSTAERVAGAGLCPVRAVREKEHAFT